MGADDTEIVAVITPGGNNLYLAVQGVNMQLDNSVPQNSIELYYPPAALSNATQINDAVSSNRPTRNSKANLVSTRSLTRTNVPDRFGIVRQGHGMSSVKTVTTMVLG